MGGKLSFKYDREADILHIDKRSPYAEQESEELGDEVIARLNPDKILCANFYRESSFYVSQF